MESQFSFKELYSVFLKATYPIEVGDRTIEAGEVVAAFDKIQIANFGEIRKSVSAHGGFDDRPLVTWDRTKEVKINFTQGVFSKSQLALMINSKLAQLSANSNMIFSQREELESDEDKLVNLSQSATGTIYVYDYSTGEKILFDRVSDTQLRVPSQYQTVIVDYNFAYQNTAQRLTIGSRLTQGFLSLEGRTRVKDDITGQTKTAILTIPKMKLMSTLSMSLGQNANPVVGSLQAVAYPEGENRDEDTVMQFYFLDDDIDSDL